MRITNNMLFRQSLRYINLSYGRIGKTQQNISSGQAILRPSDDPNGTARALRLRTQLNRLEMHLQNVDDISDNLDMTDLALGQIGDIFVQIKDIALNALTDTKSIEDRKAAGSEVTELVAEIHQLANFQSSGRYIFAGDKPWQAPFNVATDPITNREINDGVYQGGANEPAYEIDKGVVVKGALSGMNLFMDSTDLDGKNLFQIVEQIRDSLLDNDIDPDPTDSTTPLDDIRANLTLLDKAFDKVVAARVTVGAIGGRLTRLGGVRDKLESEKLITQEILTNIEGTDIIAASTYLAEQEAVYQAALAVSAKTMQRQNILSYLR